MIVPWWDAQEPVPRNAKTAVHVSPAILFIGKSLPVVHQLERWHHLRLSYGCERNFAEGI